MATWGVGEWTLGVAILTVIVTALVGVPTWVLTHRSAQRSKERRDVDWSVRFEGGALVVTNDGLDAAYDVTFTAIVDTDGELKHAVERVDPDASFTLPLPGLTAKRAIEDKPPPPRSVDPMFGSMSYMPDMAKHTREMQRQYDIWYKIAWRSKLGTWDRETGRTG